MAGSLGSTERLLMTEYKELSKERWLNVELNADNVFDWTIALMVVNPDSLYYGGYLKARLNFPKTYPYLPPDFKFLRPLYHPNIYPDGRLCISILHAPGDDETSGELASERWSPVQRVETVLISILSLLDDANSSSPANVDASVMLRDNLQAYKTRVNSDVEASKKDIPEGFVMPTHESVMQKSKGSKTDEDDDFWADSGDEEEEEGDDDEEDMFGGSDSDAEMTMDDEDGDGETGSEDEEDTAEVEEAGK